MKNNNGEIIKIGQIDSQYRNFGGRQGLMTKGMSKGVKDNECCILKENDQRSTRRNEGRIDIIKQSLYFTVRKHS